MLEARYQVWEVDMFPDASICFGSMLWKCVTGGIVAVAVLSSSHLRLTNKINNTPDHVSMRKWFAPSL